MSLSGKTIVFTGTLSMKRADATKAAEAAGAKVGGSVTKNTHILVAGPGAGAKEEDAKAKGVEIWTEAQFTSAIGGGGGGVSSAPPAAAAAAAPKGKGKQKAPPEEEPEAAPAKKAKSKASEPPPPSSPAGAAAKPASTPPGARTPGVDRVARGLGASVYLDYDAKLNQAVVDGPVNSNKFYIIQVLQKGSLYACWNRYGRVGEEGQNNQAKLQWGSAEVAIKDFEKKFKDKSANAWADKASFVKKAGKYQLVEVEDDDDAGSSGAVLGKLTREQIERGQAVLLSIRTALERGERVPSSLFNDYYSLIPTVVGRAKPPPLDDFGILGEKEAQLEFWLRMVRADSFRFLPIPSDSFRFLPIPSGYHARPRAPDRWLLMLLSAAWLPALLPLTERSGVSTRLSTGLRGDDHLLDQPARAPRRDAAATRSHEGGDRHLRPRLDLLGARARPHARLRRAHRTH